MRLFGRRVSHRLSQSQQRLWDELLPTVAIDFENSAPSQLPDLFASKVKEVWLEIGFGGGEHLTWQAVNNPTSGLIGCEPFVNGVVKVLHEIEENRLFNIRVHAGDARQVVAWLNDATITKAFALFPDPWPKKRHHKRRLLTPAFVAELGRVMKPGSELRVATDIGDYARSTLLVMTQCNQFVWRARNPRDWCERPDDWPQTRYERKAIRAGRRCSYFRFERTRNRSA